MPECLTIMDLCKSFGSLNVLDHLNLNVVQGERLAIIGPSGAGKTTLLKIIADLEPLSSGKLHRNSGKTGFVFQEPRLIPWRRVKDNLLFVNPRGNYQRILSQVGLSGFENYLPCQLSGGMRQRVNLARALINNPDLLLLDEAFLSLDLKIKLMIIANINKLWQSDNFTLITVTHDPKEALLLADRIILLSTRPASITNEFQVKLSTKRSITSPELLDYETSIIEILAGFK